MHTIKQIIFFISAALGGISFGYSSTPSLIFDDCIEASGVKIKTLQGEHKSLNPEDFYDFSSAYSIMSGFVGSTYCPGYPSAVSSETQVMDGCLGITNLDPQTNMPTFMGLGVGDGYGGHLDAIEDQAIIRCVQKSLQKTLYSLYTKPRELDLNNLHDTLSDHLNQVGREIMQQKGYDQCSPGTTLAFAVVLPFQADSYHLIAANMGDSYIGVFHPDPEAPQWTTVCPGRKDPYGGVAKFPTAMTKQDLEVKRCIIQKGDFVIVATDGFSDELPYDDAVEQDKAVDIESYNSFKTRHFNDKQITGYITKRLRNQKPQELNAAQFRDVLKQILVERADIRRLAREDHQAIGDDVGVLVGHVAATQPSLLKRLYNNIVPYLW
jgi:Serine/threonine protein phosphatase